MINWISIDKKKHDDRKESQSDISLLPRLMNDERPSKVPAFGGFVIDMNSFIYMTKDVNKISQIYLNI